MNKKCDINGFRETAEIRNKLKKLGICSVVGPTGPRGLPGTNINIRGSFNSLEELMRTYPQGKMWDTGEPGPQGIQGPRGEPNGVGAYGERYSTASQRFNVTAGMDTIIPLEQTGTAFLLVMTQLTQLT